MADPKAGKNEGEGSRSADRAYREQAEKFAESGRVDDAAASAARARDERPDELEEAEEAGRRGPDRA